MFICAFVSTPFGIVVEAIRIQPWLHDFQHEIVAEFIRIVCHQASLATLTLYILAGTWIFSSRLHMTIFCHQLFFNEIWSCDRMATNLCIMFTWAESPWLFKTPEGSDALKPFQNTNMRFQSRANGSDYKWAIENMNTCVHTTTIIVKACNLSYYNEIKNAIWWFQHTLLHSKVWIYDFAIKT